MSNLDRPDAQSGTPSKLFSMPRDYSFSCMLESGRDKHREKDGSMKRFSSTVSLDEASVEVPPIKQRGSDNDDLMSSGRLGGASCNGWHDDVISRSKIFTEPRTHSGNSAGRVVLQVLGSTSMVQYGLPSPKDLDEHQYFKPGSPLFVHSRISSNCKATPVKCIF